MTTRSFKNICYGAYLFSFSGITMLDIIQEIISDFSVQEDVSIIYLLVVGDGNFSFSKELSSKEFTCSKTIHIYATSLDSLEKLEKCASTLDHINFLHRQQNVFIKHGVDATKLKEVFPQLKFHVIIFNFPHVGGKSNIKKCRLLLEDFFRSCNEVLADGGRVIVSLCKGQSGLPCDASRGCYGNSWQVATQACKSGFILSDVRKFDRAQVSNYSEAGYRGNVDKWFRTQDGLVHVFNRCSFSFKNETGPDLLASFIGSFDGRARNIYDTIVKKISKTIFNFWGIKSDMIDIKDFKDELEKLDNFLAFAHDTLILKDNFVADKILTECFRRFPAVSKLHFICWDSAKYMLPFFHAANQRLIFRIPKERCEDFKVWLFAEMFKGCHITKDEKEQLLFDKRITFTCGYTSKPHKYYDASSVPYFIKDIPSYYLTEYQPDITSYKKGKIENNFETLSFHDYILTKQEKTYFRKKMTSKSDVYSINEFPIYCFLENESERFVEFNLDNILQTCYMVDDLRYIYSNDDVFREGLLSRINASPTFYYDDESRIPTFVKYPLCYRHDICFWLRDGNIEEELFHEIRSYASPYLHSVRLLKILRYEATDEISYCYRMIYSSVDSPLTHLQTVDLQNNLRKHLISKGYDLR